MRVLHPFVVIVSVWAVGLSPAGWTSTLQATDRSIPLAGGILVTPPPGWSVVASRVEGSFVEMVRRRPVTETGERKAVMIDAHLVVTLEIRRSHEEAVQRLAEIAAEEASPSSYLPIGDWPGLRRRYRALLRERGEDEPEEESIQKQLLDPVEELALHTTTAIAAGPTLVRVEGVVSPGSPVALADEVERLAEELTFGLKGEPMGTQRAIEELRAVPSFRLAVPIAPPPNVGAAPPPEEALDMFAFGAVRVHQGLGELQIAVSANGQNVVIGTNSGYSNSTDGGQSFTFRGPTPGNFPRNGDPSVGWGPSGSFYYAFIGFPNGSPPGTGNGCTSSVARSSDNGQTFNWVGHATLCPRFGPNFCFPDQEQLAVDRVNPGLGGDQLYVAWRNFTSAVPVTACNQITSGVVTPMIACSADGGVTWPLAEVIGAGGDSPRVSVGGDGFVYVVYSTRTGVMLDKLSSCATGLVRQVGFPVTVAAAVAGVACPVSGLDRCDASLASPMVAVDDTNPGHIFVAFSTASASGTEDVVVHDSLDGGLTWPGVAQANAPVPGRRFMPWVCAANGVAQVSWYDRRAASTGSNDLTAYYHAAVGRSSGRLLPQGERNVSGVNDPQCASGWPCAPRATGDAESCSVQPQLAGLCLTSSGGGSRLRCDFSQATCPVGETCQPARGCPKYGDYNGNACASGLVYSAWSSATPPPGVTAPPGINIFAEVGALQATGLSRADYCRRIGDENHVSSFVTCTASTGTGFGSTFQSGLLDWGYDAGAAWVDFNGDAKADYCRRIGDENHVSSFVACTASTGTGFGSTFQSGLLDWGYDAGAAWVDFNGDGRADYCRRIGDENHVSSFVACTVSTGSGFGLTFQSGLLDWGYDAGASWVDFNGDGRADYCRRIGDENQVSSFVACTVSTGTGFGTTFQSGLLDWGYDAGAAWVDFDGDGRADYCRRIGDENHVSSFVTCTVSTGTGFGATFQSGLLDWGYDAGVSWVDFDGPNN